MKNVHLIATDKPSRLCINAKNQMHIYITFDEEIKEDVKWIIHNGKIHEVIENKELYISVKELNHIDIRKDLCKKIILTTDQDLIKDGVQPINDKFLEWFVKNPSCEEVKVVKGFADGTNYGYNFLDYKIIIPKEEAKQERMYSEEDMFKFSQWISHNDWVYLPSKGYWVNEEQEELEQKLSSKEILNMWFE